MFYEILMKLCAQEGISLTALLSEELHMSTGNITNWKNGIIPKSDTVSKLANYFNVSTDYLLGNKQKNKPAALSSEQDPRDAEIIAKLNTLNPANREAALSVIETLLKNQDKH